MKAVFSPPYYPGAICKHGSIGVIRHTPLLLTTPEDIWPEVRIDEGVYHAGPSGRLPNLANIWSWQKTLDWWTFRYRTGTLLDQRYAADAGMRWRFGEVTMRMTMTINGRTLHTATCLTEHKDGLPFAFNK
uniref:DUF4440 domain-containing protein n=1 Tax=Ascaris lumbricoides TaxID=6252 RepID=A0A0M3HT09_ASCLU